MICVLLIFLTWIGFGFTSLFKRPGETWAPPMPGKPPTLVFRRADLQKIWEWEIASGHYPSTRPSAYCLIMRQCKRSFYRHSFCDA